MPLAGKIVTVLVLKAVLLGMDAPSENPTTSGYAMVPWSQLMTHVSEGNEYMHITGERILHDNLSGLTIVVGPSGGAASRLFEDSYGVQPDIQEQVLRPAEDGSWADVEFDFPIPRTGSTYFMEQVEENLFRRVEFSGRAGFGTHMSLSPSADGVEVELQLKTRLLTALKYERIMDAWLSKPHVTTIVVGTQLVLPTNKQVLLIVRPGTIDGTGGGPFSTEMYRNPPMGLAMLLELRQWEFLPAPAELRRELEPLAKALGAATGGRARLDLQNTHTPVVPDLPQGVTPPEHGYLTVMPITTQGDELALITDGEEQYAPVVALRVGREAGVLLPQDAAHGSFGIHRLPPGVYLAARDQTARAGWVFLGLSGEGTAMTKVESSGVLSDGKYYEPAASAPQMPFAEFERWGRMIGVTGAKFRVWFPAGGADESRQSITVSVAEPAAKRGGVFGDDSGFGGTSNRGGSSRSNY